MPRVAVYNLEGEQVGDLDLSEEVFGAPIHENVLHEYIVMYQANQRLGTASVKTRAEVSGGGRKPWRQKGTGRARVGSNRSPLWRHGGVIFGPKPRDYHYSIPKKKRRLAMRSALSAKVKDNDLIVLDEILMQEPKTKVMAQMLQKINDKKKALIVTAEADENVKRSSRNIPGVKPTCVQNLNPYDLLLYDKLVITRDAVSRIEEVWGCA